MSGPAARHFATPLGLPIRRQLLDAVLAAFHSRNVADNARMVLGHPMSLPVARSDMDGLCPALLVQNHGQVLIEMRPHPFSIE